MDIQTIVVFLLFLMAVGFIGQKLYKSLGLKDGGGCSKGCGCSVDKLEKSK
ncbi:FeoB-associated Cys-rich membrane protein [Dyadobacter tibetensis]|uniref:FeoB-associated Cys-rich membrane protein n=1 Tax=Dyadobacter tibetensis TaxID=1211851 RepID=UPI0004B56B08|nr:FeoB-associated Cys-rich membrane protein [Dyadobacter tibetensis]